MEQPSGPPSEQPSVGQNAPVVFARQNSRGSSQQNNSPRGGQRNSPRGGRFRKPRTNNGGKGGSTPNPTFRRQNSGDNGAKGDNKKSFRGRGNASLSGPRGRNGRGGRGNGRRPTGEQQGRNRDRASKNGSWRNAKNTPDTLQSRRTDKRQVKGRPSGKGRGRGSGSRGHSGKGKDSRASPRSIGKDSRASPRSIGRVPRPSAKDSNSPAPAKLKKLPPTVKSGGWLDAAKKAPVIPPSLTRKPKPPPGLKPPLPQYKQRRPNTQLKGSITTNPKGNSNMAAYDEPAHHTQQLQPSRESIPYGQHPNAGAQALNAQRLSPQFIYWTKMCQRNNIQDVDSLLLKMRPYYADNPKVQDLTDQAKDMVAIAARMGTPQSLSSTPGGAPVAVHPKAQRLAVNTTKVTPSAKKLSGTAKPFSPMSQQSNASAKSLMNPHALEFKPVSPVNGLGPNEWNWADVPPPSAERRLVKDILGEPSSTTTNGRARAGKNNTSTTGGLLEKGKQLTASSSVASPALGKESTEDHFPHEACLFVGDIPRSATEEMLKNVFGSFGTILNIDIKKDKITNNNLGYAFIHFLHRAHAADAMRRLQKAHVGGRAIRVGWAQKNTNLFVAHLDSCITSTDLREAFRSFGPIYEEDSFIKGTGSFVKGTGFGFVKFKYRKDAESARRKLDNVLLQFPSGHKNSCPVKIGWGDANTQRNCVHVQFKSNTLNHSPDVTEADFQEHFRIYGRVVKVSLPKDANTGSFKGYAFVHFEETEAGENAAAAAIAHLSGTKLARTNTIITCNFGKRQRRKVREGEENDSAAQQTNWQNGNTTNGTAVLHREMVGEEGGSMDPFHYEIHGGHYEIHGHYEMMNDLNVGANGMSLLHQPPTPPSRPRVYSQQPKLHPGAMPYHPPLQVTHSPLTHMMMGPGLMAAAWQMSPNGLPMAHVGMSPIMQGQTQMGSPSQMLSPPIEIRSPDAAMMCGMMQVPMAGMDAMQLPQGAMPPSPALLPQARVLMSQRSPNQSTHHHPHAQGPQLTHSYSPSTLLSTMGNPGFGAGMKPILPRLSPEQLPVGILPHVEVPGIASGATQPPSANIVPSQAMNS